MISNLSPEAAVPQVLRAYTSSRKEYVPFTDKRLKKDLEALGYMVRVVISAGAPFLATVYWNGVYVPWSDATLIEELAESGYQASVKKYADDPFAVHLYREEPKEVTSTLPEKVQKFLRENNLHIERTLHADAIDVHPGGQKGKTKGIETLYIIDGKPQFLSTTKDAEVLAQVMKVYLERKYQQLLQDEALRPGIISKINSPEQRFDQKLLVEAMKSIFGGEVNVFNKDVSLGKIASTDQDTSAEEILLFPDARIIYGSQAGAVALGQKTELYHQHIDTLVNLANSLLA